MTCGIRDARPTVTFPAAEHLSWPVLILRPLTAGDSVGLICCFGPQNKTVYSRMMIYYNNSKPASMYRTTLPLFGQVASTSNRQFGNINSDKVLNLKSVKYEGRNLHLGLSFCPRRLYAYRCNSANDTLIPSLHLESHSTDGYDWIRSKMASKTDRFQRLLAAMTV